MKEISLKSYENMLCIGQDSQILQLKVEERKIFGKINSEETKFSN